MVSRVGHGTPRLRHLRISVLTYGGFLAEAPFFVAQKFFKKVFDIRYIQVYTIDVNKNRSGKLSEAVSGQN